MLTLELLDPVSLRAFVFAAREQNFTVAAQRASLTQSGISQHIAKLEDALQTKLFDRVGRSVRLSDQGRILLEHAEDLGDRTENLISRLRGERREMRGLVRYAMPESCLYTPHFPLLLQERWKRFPEVKLEVSIRPSDEVSSGVLNGSFDFGFVTRLSAHRDLSAKVFASEVYMLVENATRSRTVKKDPLERDWIFYPGMDVLFDAWVKASYPRLKKPPVLEEMSIVGRADHLQTARMMAGGLDALSIFPSHCIEDLLKTHRLKELGKTQTRLRHPIHIVALEGRLQSERVRVVTDAFFKML